MPLIAASLALPSWLSLHQPEQNDGYAEPQWQKCQRGRERVNLYAHQKPARRACVAEKSDGAKYHRMRFRGRMVAGMRDGDPDGRERDGRRGAKQSCKTLGFENLRHTAKTETTAPPIRNAGRVPPLASRFTELRGPPGLLDEMLGLGDVLAAQQPVLLASSR